jgi:NAD(P)-dependent dehydrogenase (short-subunit alcohol dehydrogenase family)
MRLKDKVAVVRGAASGIGKEIARKFADESVEFRDQYARGARASWGITRCGLAAARTDEPLRSSPGAGQ